MTFLTQRRLVKEGVTGREPGALAFGVVCLFFTCMAVFCAAELRTFSSGAPVVTVSAWSVAFIGFLGFWGIHLSSWVALARGNRMPQQVEWIIFLCLPGVAIALMFVTGPLVSAYGATHGYRFCSSTHQMPSDFTFAALGRPCPAPPAMTRR